MAFIFIWPFLPLQAQIYRIYRPVPVGGTAYEPADTVPSGWEVSASSVLSFGAMKDGAGWTLSDYMQGVRVRIQKSVTDALSIWAEGEILSAADIRTEFLNKMEKSSFSAVLVYDLTPQTSPNIYILFSGGVVFNRAALEMAFGKDLNQTGAVWSVGIGTFIPIYRGWRLNGEYRVSYEPSPWRNFIVRASSSLRQEMSLGLSWQF